METGNLSCWTLRELTDGAPWAIFLEDQPLHVIQRGNNRDPIFFGAEDHAQYRDWLAAAAMEYDCAIHAYVLITNLQPSYRAPAPPLFAGMTVAGWGERP
jgi:hypothetical protein